MQSRPVGRSRPDPVAAGSGGARRAGIPAPIFYGLVGFLMLTNALAVGAVLMSPDIARLMNGQNAELLLAYQDRVTQLRIEVDRLHSRSFAQAGDLNLQLQELSAQQELLAEQHLVVRALVGKANELGIEAASLPAPGRDEQAALSFSPTGHPDIDMTAEAIEEMMAETRYALSAISGAASGKAETIRAELARLGIEIPAIRAAMTGAGGPFLPPMGEETADLLEDANAVLAALYSLEAARSAIDRAPVHMPIAGSFRQSSGFGNRSDPFGGGLAFHSGLDFAAATGTTVMSAGDGRVTFAGTNSGYGKMVEITHENGLVTRYAHLSAILVENGQAVRTGAPIGKVGSTGRSTGPHLHFEVRRADRALDPKTFLDAGRRLLALI